MPVNILDRSHRFIVYYPKESHINELGFKTVLADATLDRRFCAQRGPDRHRGRYKLTLRGDVDRENGLYDPLSRTVYSQSHFNDELFVSTAGYICQYSNYTIVPCSEEQYHTELRKDYGISPHLHITYMPDMITVSPSGGDGLIYLRDQHQMRAVGYLYKFGETLQSGHRWFNDTLGLMQQPDPFLDDDDDKYRLMEGDDVIAMDDIHKNGYFWWHPGEYVVRVWKLLDHGYFLSSGGYLCSARNYGKFDTRKYLLITD